MDKVVGKLEKPDGSIIQVSVVEWQSNLYLDIREMYEDNEGNLKFSKKGIRFQKDLASELMEILKQV